MAKLKFGAIITDTRGTLGGTTIKGTRAGPVMQTKANPTRNQNPTTSHNRALLAALSKDWFHTLTVSQRDDWRALAAANPLPNTWGDEFPLSGIAFYIRTNLSLAAIDQPSLTDAPLDQAVTALASVTLSVTAPNTASVAFTPTPTPTDHRLLIAATPQLSPGKENFTAEFFNVQYGAAAQASPLSIAAAYNALVGNFRAGQQYAIRATFVDITNGARATPLVSATLAI